MRALFLDFDGVLHPLGLKVPAGCLVQGEQLSVARDVDFFGWVPLLEQMLAGHPDVVLVAHTSWRESHTPQALGAYLGALQPRFVGATRAGLDKHASILDWVRQNPDLLDYRILDDAAQEFPQEPAPRELIACDWRTGIAADDVQHQLQHWLQGG